LSGPFSVVCSGSSPAACGRGIGPLRLMVAMICFLSRTCRAWLGARFTSTSDAKSSLGMRSRVTSTRVSKSGMRLRRHRHIHCQSSCEMHQQGADVADDTPHARKGQAPRPLSREVFGERFRQSFYDPKLESEKEALGRIEVIAWEAYDESRKTPITQKAGPGFADPN